MPPYSRQAVLLFTGTLSLASTYSLILGSSKKALVYAVSLG